MTTKLNINISINAFESVVDSESIMISYKKTCDFEDRFTTIDNVIENSSLLSDTIFTAGNLIYNVVSYSISISLKIEGTGNIISKEIDINKDELIESFTNGTVKELYLDLLKFLN